MRWVVNGAGSAYLGDQREALGFGWSVKLGSGIEFNVGRQEISALGLNLTRVRFLGRYFFGENSATGASFGIGMSF